MNNHKGVVPCRMTERDDSVDDVADGGNGNGTWENPQVLFQGEKVEPVMGMDHPVGQSGPPPVLPELSRLRERLGTQPFFDGGNEIPEYDETGYIAGPMTGLPGHNYASFNAVAVLMRGKNWLIKNPAENFDGDQTRELSEYMTLDLRMVVDTEAIILLPGWRNSEGARLEATVAKRLKHRFYEAILKDGGDPSISEDWIVTAIAAPSSTDNRGIDGKARSLVFGARNADYGPPVLDFTVVGRIWAAQLSAHLQIHIDDIPPKIVASMLTGLKLGRQSRTPDHEDSAIDIVGYQDCLERIVTDDGKKPWGRPSSVA